MKYGQLIQTEHFFTSLLILTLLAIFQKNITTSVIIYLRLIDD